MRNKFDEQLEKLHVGLIQMGAACEDAISAAAEGLVNPVDKLVDERLKQINEDQLKVLQDIATNTRERGLTWQ